MHGDVAGRGRAWLQVRALGVGAEMALIGEDGDGIGEARGLWWWCLCILRGRLP